MASEIVYQKIDKFHAHLDICSQCRNQPFNLCPIGARLLIDAATTANGELEEKEEGEELCTS